MGAHAAETAEEAPQAGGSQAEEQRAKGAVNREDFNPTLYSLDPLRIGSLVGAEAQLGLENAVLSPQWPVPESRVRGIQPNRVPAQVVPAFTLFGEGLMRNAEVVLRPVAGKGPDLVYVARDSSGSFQETQLLVREMDLSRAAPGRYRVCVPISLAPR